MPDENEILSAKTESEPDAVLTERIGNTTFCIGIHFRKDTARQYGDCVKNLLLRELEKKN